MSTQALFHSLQISTFATDLGKLNPLYGALAQLFHIAGLLLILSAILLVNLRLLGAGLLRQSVPQLVKATNPLIWYGLILVALSGLYTFLPAADLYYHNPAFWTKILLLLLALLIQFTLYRKVTVSKSPNHTLAKVTALLSLTLWFGVAFAGRAIGFV
jgi:hypothetical protein